MGRGGFLDLSPREKGRIIAWLYRRTRERYDIIEVAVANAVARVWGGGK